MRFWIVSLLVAVALTASPAFAAGSDTTKAPVKGAIFEPARDAAKDIKDAAALAKQSKKNVLLEVGGNWCPWCRKLNILFDENKEIRELLAANYVVVHVNWSKENKNEAVLSQYPKVAGYPHIFILDGEAKLMRSQDTGALEEGDHHSPAKVVSFLNEWKPK